MENKEVIERLEQLKSPSGYILDRDGLENLVQDLEETNAEGDNQ